MNKPLQSYGILSVTGEKSDAFLQGQLTCDILSLAEKTAKLCAHLNPQGRIISLFYIIAQDQGYYLLMPRDLITITQAALKKYAVFYRSLLEDVSDHMTLYITRDVPENEKQSHYPILATPFHFYLGTSNPFAISSFEWKRSLIEAGIPTLYGKTSGLFLPHELNLPQWDAISFNKGCYTGQEIVARMHYKGKLKKILSSYKLSASQVPIPGSPIYFGIEKAGVVVDAIDTSTHSYSTLLLLDNRDFMNKPLTMEASSV